LDGYGWAKHDIASSEAAIATVIERVQVMVSSGQA
jgi:hypothetical protein